MSMRLDCTGGHPQGHHFRECWRHEIDRFVQIAVALGENEESIIAAVDSAGVAWVLDAESGDSGRWRELPPHPSTQWDEHGDPIPEGGKR